MILKHINKNNTLIILKKISIFLSYIFAILMSAAIILKVVDILWALAIMSIIPFGVFLFYLNLKIKNNSKKR
jgi:hypothetical protein